MAERAWIMRHGCLAVTGPMIDRVIAKTPRRAGPRQLP